MCSVNQFSININKNENSFNRAKNKKFRTASERT